VGVRLMPPSAGASDFTGTLDVAAASAGAVRGCSTLIGMLFLGAELHHDSQWAVNQPDTCKPAQYYCCRSVRLLMGDAATSSTSCFAAPQQSDGRCQLCMHAHRIVDVDRQARCFVACLSTVQTSLKVPAKAAHTCCMLAEVNAWRTTHSNCDPALEHETSLRGICALYIWRQQAESDDWLAGLHAKSVQCVDYFLARTLHCNILLG
jgi:hypothetical protein